MDDDMQDLIFNVLFYTNFHVISVWLKEENWMVKSKAWGWTVLEWVWAHLKFPV